MAGPNFLTLSQVDDPDLADLISKVMMYYHGKACKDATCMDLSRNQPYDGTLTGHSCSTGGLKVSGIPMHQFPLGFFFFFFSFLCIGNDDLRHLGAKLFI